MSAAALGAFVTYAIASCFFWHYPHLLHKKKKIQFQPPGLIAHRGGSAEGYENTIRAFKNAMDKGTEMLELDVRLTKDGHVVVFHDPDLFRMAGKSDRVSELVYAQLPQLKTKVPIDTLPGQSFYDPSWLTEDRRIPLLSQVLSHFPNVPINIDIKDNNDELIEKVAKMLEEYKRKEITVWGSFNNRVCQKCYEISPDTCLFFSAKRIVTLTVLAVLGLLPFTPIKETHYEVFLPLAMKRRRLQQVGQLSAMEKVLLWVSKILVWKPFISHLKKRGIHVYYWVCNTEDEYELCNSIGANGIMTDKPTNLRIYLDAEGSIVKS